MRLGLIAEEVEEILPELVNFDEEGLPESVDYSKLTSVIINAVKEIGAKVADLGSQISQLASRVTNLEQTITNATSTPSAIFSVDGMLDGLESLGAQISENFAGFKSLAAETFTLGTSERPSGVTLYDEANGEPYCLKVKNSRIVSTRGECGDSPGGQNPDDSDNTDDDTDDEKDGEVAGSVRAYKVEG